MKNPVAKFMSMFNQPKVEQDSRSELYEKIRRLEAEVEELKPKKPVKVWNTGARVTGSKTCGFNRAMKGTVTYVEPNGETIWVRRDGSTGDVFYFSDELIEI